MTIEQARQEYSELKSRVQALEGNEKKLFEDISQVSTGRYCVKWDEVMLLENVYGNNKTDMALAFFGWDFCGDRARRKRDRERRRRNERTESF